jgi:hypothetical protein
MNEQEQELADDIYRAIQSASNLSERSQQSSSFRIGPSDLGFCSERMRRMLAGIPEPETDKLPAFIGTALGDHVEKAIARYLWPDATLQATVTLTLQGDAGRSYTISGHPDVLHRNRVIDVKSVNGLEMKRRTGPDMQQQFQRHCYALGAFNGGLLDAETLDDVEVANVWIDRSGMERCLHVHMEPFSMDVVEQAAQWIDEVVYAYANNEPARKEPPYAMCAKACGHFFDCRAGDGDVEGLIDDEETLSAIELLNEAKAMESEAKRKKNQAQIALQGVEGSTGTHTVKWTLVNGGNVNFTRDSYLRLDVRKVRPTERSNKQ